MNTPTYHVSPQLLAARYDNPPKRTMARAVSEFLAHGNVCDLWSELCRLALIPEGLATDERRRFACESEESVIWPDSRPPEYDLPRHVSHMLAIANDPAGIIKAEKSALELAKRMMPWGAICNEKIVWYFTDNPYEDWYYSPAIDFAADTALWTLLLDHEIDLRQLLPELDQVRLPNRVKRHLSAFEAWFIAADRDFRLVQPPWIDFGSLKTFADVENPFEPLVDIWLTGYRLSSAFTEQDPFIRLYAWPVRPEVNVGTQNGRDGRTEDGTF